LRSAHEPIRIIFDAARCAFAPFVIGADSPGTLGERLVGVWQEQSPSRNVVESASRLAPMIRKLPSGKYRLYSRRKNPRTGRRRNLGMFSSRAAAERHEREVQFFRRRAQ